MKVIVTGASKGIGRGIATVLAREGHTVGLAARSTELLADLERQLADQGARTFYRTADLTSPDETHRSLLDLIDEMEGVDALVNNAGTVLRKDVWSITVEEWKHMMDVNINGVFYATRAVLPTMKTQGSGHIINVSSISGKFPLPGGSGYAASKFAITGFSQSLFQEVRDQGIKVTTLYPGSVDSASHRHDPGADHTWKVTPEEVGRACLDVLCTRHGNCVSEVEIRPLGRPPKS
jgi:hypothetical protein